MEWNRDSPAPRQHFATTRWSLVLRARSEDLDPGQARAALEELCRDYWVPLYTFVHHRGYQREDAADLVQGFIGQLLERDFLKNLAPEQGRFRSFLLTSLKHFLADEHARASARKRGGGVRPVSLELLADSDWAFEPATGASPDRLFDRKWAEHVLERARMLLREDYVGTGRATLFDRLHGHLLDDPESGGYGEIARDLGMNEPAVRKAAWALRGRFGQVIRRIVAETLAQSDSLEEELRHLQSALRDGPT